MKMDVQEKREREKEMVSQMIGMYCWRRHGAEKICLECAGFLCPDCAELNTYAKHHSDKCPFMETKTFCSNCKVHCYKPDMREKIRAVMRFSGPRMLFSHPIMAMRHVIETKREKRRLKIEQVS